MSTVKISDGASIDGAVQKTVIIYHGTTVETALRVYSRHGAILSPFQQSKYTLGHLVANPRDSSIDVFVAELFKRQLNAPSYVLEKELSKAKSVIISTDPWLARKQSLSQVESNFDANGLVMALEIPEAQLSSYSPDGNAWTFYAPRSLPLKGSLKTLYANNAQNNRYMLWLAFRKFSPEIKLLSQLPEGISVGLNVVPSDKIFSKVIE